MDYSDPNKIMDDMQQTKGVAYENASVGDTAKVSAQPAPVFVPSNAEYAPAGFWVRFVAAMVDGFIVGGVKMIILIPIVLVTTLIFGVEESSVSTIIQGLAQIAAFMLAMYYYGWFYSVKGASLGKMLMRLRVVNDTTGQNMSMSRAIWRESIGKICSAVILLIGYIMAGVRADKKALHDLMFDTQVLQRIK